MELNNAAIHCPTEELAIKTLGRLYSEGYRFFSDDLSIKSRWEVYDTNTCYCVEEDKSISYSPISYFKEEGYKIIEAEEFLTKDIMKTYKLIKSYPGSGEIGQTTQEDMSKYPEYWKEVKEDFNIGDYVYVTSQYSNNKSCAGYIGKLANIDYRGDPYFKYQVDHFWCRDVRKATPEEIEKAKEVKIGGYIVDKLGDNEFKIGCQTISKEELDVIDRFLREPIDAEITIRGTEITKKLIQKIKEL